MDQYVKLARQAIEAYIKDKNITITTLFIVQRSHIPDKLINTTNKALVDNTI